MLFFIPNGLFALGDESNNYFLISIKYEKINKRFAHRGSFAREGGNFIF
jgi:hypothetical protein